jgi:KUP system potassium uptake protein
MVGAMAARVWKWGWQLTVVVMGSFLLIDLMLVSANMVKFTLGGWVPLALAVLIFTAMWTWMKGRLAVAARERDGALPMEALLSSINPSRVHRPQGTAVYLTAFSGNAPNCLLHNLKHNEVLHEQVVLLTVQVPDEPYVPPNARAQVTHLGKGVHLVVLQYGFMEQPDVPRDLLPLADRGVPVDPMRTSYFVGRSSFVASERPLLPRWQEKLFLVLTRLSSNAGDFFGLPANRVVELGSRIEI